MRTARSAVVQPAKRQIGMHKVQHGIIDARTTGRGACGDLCNVSAAAAEDVQRQRFAALMYHLQRIRQQRVRDDRQDWTKNFFCHYCVVVGHINQHGGRNVAVGRVHLPANRGAGAVP